MALGKACRSGNRASRALAGTGGFGTAEALAESEAFLRGALQSGIPIHTVERSRLEELSKTTTHQGLVARLGAYTYSTLEDLAALVSQATNPLVVMCDRIQDSHNFGAILRSCDGAKVTAVVVGRRGQAEMTPHVIRSSSGAANYVPVIQTDDLATAVQQLQALGAVAIATGLDSSQSMWQTNFRGFNLLLLGSEAHGVHPELLAICNQTVIIPMQGHVQSLNVAVAAGILLYEIRRQQQ